MMKKVNDKLLLRIGCVLVIFTLAVPSGYQMWLRINDGRTSIKTDDMKRKPTIDGYEEPEEVVEYVLYQIHQGDLDLALRGCAIQEVAGYFFLQGYSEIMDQFLHTEMLAPADYDNQAYIEINQARMTAVYSDMLEQCMGILGEGYDLDVIRIEADIPEDADGFYYQDIRDICSITGARDACNVVVDMLIDGVPRQMKLTVARYRKYWKILQFSEYENFRYSEPQISEYTNLSNSKMLPLEWDSLEDVILPCNYQIADSKSEENIEKLVRKMFVYLQRGDIWRVMAYFDVYESPMKTYPDSLFFYRQSQIAEKLQQFYYRTFLFDRDQLSWIEQNVKSEAVNLASLLNASTMIYSNLETVEIKESEDGTAKCDIIFNYNKAWFTFTISLDNKNGWKIKDIDFRKDEDRLLFDHFTGKWCVFKNGNLNEEYTGLIQNQYGWYYAQNGILNREYEGLAENKYGWWYIRNGGVDWKYEGLAENKYGWWYIRNGTVAWDYTGTVTDNGMTYSVINGNVQR